MSYEPTDADILCRWKRINASTQGHRFLDDEDVCWYVADLDDPDIEVDLSTLKLYPSRKNALDREIGQEALAERIKNLLRYRYPEKRVALIPMPPSKAKGDKGYSDSLNRACQIAAQDFWVDAKAIEALITPESGKAVHLGRTKRSVEATTSAQGVWTGMGLEDFDVVIIVDDVISSGAHFKAAQGYIQGAYGVLSHGAFLARTPKRSFGHATLGSDAPQAPQEPKETHQGLFAKLRSWIAKRLGRQ